MRYVFIVIFLIQFLLVQAQDVVFKVSAPNIIQTGQQFRLVFTLNANGSNFKAPNLSNFIILAGPSTSSSSNISIVNGNYTKSVTYSYTYILQAADVGKFTINSASINVDGKSYSSNPLNIEVIKGQANSNSNQNQTQNNQQQQQQNNSASSTSTDDLFVRIVLNKDQVYQGEQLVATLKIYTRVNLVGFEDFKFPSYKNFWSEDVNIPNQVNLVQETYNGKVYNVGVLKKSVLFPQKSGELTIDPFELKCVVQEVVQQRQRNFWDSFFNSYQNVSKKLISPAVKVKVLPLPGNAPANFNGNVGSYQITSEANPTSLKTNESLSIKYKITGNGNIRLAELPEIKFPPQFEKFDPKTNEKINVTANGVNGSKTIEYLLIPRSAGTYSIPSVAFSYYDPSTKSYKTGSTEAFTIQVEKGENDSSVAFVSGVNKEELSLLGSDVRFLKSNSNSLQLKNNYLLSNYLFISSYFIALVLFIVIIILRRRQIKRNADLILVKNRKAGKEARKRLSTAKKMLTNNQTDKFYEEIIRVLWKYLSDKLAIPLSQLNKDSAGLVLSQKGIIDDDIKKILDLIDNCEYARFAPASAENNLNDIYNSTAQIINHLEKNVKL